jgi:inner membrane protein
MTWKSHTTVTGAWAFALTSDPGLTAAAVAGSVLPDKIEFVLPFLKHRGNTHALVLWIAGLALIPLAGLATPLWPYAFAVVAGGLAHVVEDAFSVTGVPILPSAVGSGPQLRIPLYRTGKPSELLVSLTLIALAVGFASSSLHKVLG